MEMQNEMPSIPGTTAAPLVQLGQGHAPAPKPVSDPRESEAWAWVLLGMMLGAAVAVGFVAGRM